MNVIGPHWMFEIKQCSNGSIERFKVLLVAKGFHQRHGEDYDISYSPVINAPIVSTILASLTPRCWPLHHLDICNAFSNDNLMETVYMEQPPGVIQQSAGSHI